MLHTLISFLALVSTAATDGSRPVIQGLAVPAGESSHLPNLSLGANGTMYLSWVEPGKDGTTRLLFAALTAKGWSEARPVAEGSDWFVNWADFPSVAALADGTLAAHWLARVGVETYAYGVQVSLSRDGGKTWSDSIVPHSDRSPTEHGFVTMAATKEDAFSLVWLDGRAMAGGHGSDDLDGHGGGDMSLRTVTIDREGKLGPERLIDPRVCECCQTTGAVVGGNLVVAYRDRSDEEIRDCSLARISTESISSPKTIHDDGWNQEGCPVNGPTLAARDDELAAVWYTEAAGRPQVFLAHSADGGHEFGAPVAIDDGNPVGRVDVVSHPDSGWFAIWLERGDEGGEVRGRWIATDGTKHPSVLIARTSPGRASGFPQVERVGRRVVLAWTEVIAESSGSAGPTAPTHIRTADLVFPAAGESE